MVGEKDSNLEVMVNAIKIAIKSSATSLNHVTNSLNKKYNGLNADQLPEYQKALDAIKAYKKALIERFSENYKEE